MAYVRIDENAIDHPKFVAISANAFRLWVEGTSYCQKHLTDGFIPTAALKRFRYYSPSSAKMLLDELVPNKGPLWHQDAAGVNVHDYLEHNDPRDVVLKGRKDAKDRYKRWKDKRDNASTNASTTRSSNATTVPSLTFPSRSERTERVESTDAVRRFIESHETLYRKYHDVGYIGNPQKDYQAACQIVKAFPDVGMQDAILVYGLNDPDPFMAKDTRTIPKIASRASKYAEELKAKRLA